MQVYKVEHDYSYGYTTELLDYRNHYVLSVTRYDDTSVPVLVMTTPNTFRNKSTIAAVRKYIKTLQVDHEITLMGTRYPEVLLED